MNNAKWYGYFNDGKSEVEFSYTNRPHKLDVEIVGRPNYFHQEAIEAVENGTHATGVLTLNHTDISYHHALKELYPPTI